MKKTRGRLEKGGLFFGGGKYQIKSSPSPVPFHHRLPSLHPSLVPKSSRLGFRRQVCEGEKDEQGPGCHLTVYTRAQPGSLSRPERIIQINHARRKTPLPLFWRGTHITTPPPPPHFSPDLVHRALLQGTEGLAQTDAGHICMRLSASSRSNAWLDGH